MNVPSAVKSLSNLELSVLVVFAIYLAMPIQMPAYVANMIDSPMGMLGIFLVTIYLFLYANPILAILYVFVAYEMLRRSSNIAGRVEMIPYTPSQIKKDAQMKAMNPAKATSLEEEIVEQMAPIGQSDLSVYTPSSFKPVAEKIGSASMY
jgi:hypothetical protein